MYCSASKSEIFFSGVRLSPQSHCCSSLMVGRTSVGVVSGDVTFHSGEPSAAIQNQRELVFLFAFGTEPSVINGTYVQDNNFAAPISVDCHRPMCT